jgi:regulator of replication initiation timing
MLMETNAEKRYANNRNYLLAALLILVALNIVVLYFWYQERQDNRTKDATIAAKTEEVLLTKSKLDSISTQLDAQIVEVRRLGGSVDSLVAIRTQLETDKRNLRNVNSFDLKKYQDKIRRYESLLTQKDAEIARLRAENGELVTQNQTLNQENSGLKGERASLADSVTEYASRNRDLAAKVTRASALRLENLTVNVLNGREKERKGGSYKSRWIDKLKITGRLADNELAQKNEKMIYLRILDPTGAVISDMATGSGEFTANGQGMAYTISQPVAFDNTRQEVTFLFGQPNKRFVSGSYAVELYAEGYKIGTGEFTVR